MIRKTVWRYRPVAESGGVSLIIRLVSTKDLAEPMCAIELHRKGPDKLEKIEFPVTKKTSEAIQEGVYWLRDLELPTRRNRDQAHERPDIQHRCEDKTGLVLMREIPSFRHESEMELHYKIGDGAGFDYTFESFDALEQFTRKLGTLVHTRVSSE